jgi:hypothetical protein
VITALVINLGDEAGGATLPDVNWIMNNLSLVAGISLTTIGFISLSSLYKIVSLSSGGSKVARSLGGTLITTRRLMIHYAVVCITSLTLWQLLQVFQCRKFTYWKRNRALTPLRQDLPPVTRQ